MCKLFNHSRTNPLIWSTFISGVLLFITGTGVLADEVAQPVGSPKSDDQSFVVTTQQELITVKATNASLKDVIERIGHELGIDVDAQVGEEDKVTAAFDDLSLKAALKYLSGNYAYTTDTAGGKVSKIFLYPKGEDAQRGLNVMNSNNEGATGRRAGSAEPFKFEFDPRGFMKEGQ